MVPETCDLKKDSPGGLGMPGRLGALVIFILPFSFMAVARADWPAWRGDARRSATTDEELPEELSLHWRLQLPRLEPAWPDQARLQFDICYQPIEAGGRSLSATSRLVESWIARQTTPMAPSPSLSKIV